MSFGSSASRRESVRREKAVTRIAIAAPAAKRLPVKSFRIGDCSASIWGREFVAQGQPRVFYSVTLERSYKDRDGAWKYTKSFDLDSLGSVVALCQQASEAIAALQEREDAAQAR